MRPIAFLVIATGFLVPLLGSAPASAQFARGWVSGAGDDANPCSRTAPCKTFDVAVAKTSVEIDCVDPGGFDPVTITKEITLNCHEMFGSIVASGVPGITVNAPGANVILRNLQINGAQGSAAVAGTIGVHILAAASVSIEDCVITQFTQQGISDARTAGNTKLFIRNSVISHNLSSGIAVTATGPNNVEIENTSSINNLFGVATGTGNNVMIRRSFFSGNGTGVQADPGGGVNVDNTAITGNGTGVNASGTIRLSNSDITFNTTGFTGTATSYGNNRLLRNGTLGSSMSALSQQ